jgi:carboxylesterase type B
MRQTFLTIAIAAMPWMSAIANSAAKVEQGLLQGTVEEDLTTYRGIPFAPPPTNELRWRPPQPAGDSIRVKTILLAFGKNGLTRQKNISCSVNSREEKES